MNGSFLSTNVVTYTTTPLMIACAYNRRDIVAYLISFSDEININFQDEILGNTPLMISALHGYHEIVKILLQLPNIDVNLSRNESGDNDTSLHLATKFGQLDVFLELLAHPKINAGKSNKVP
jgi:ankyrin repeat protein